MPHERRLPPAASTQTAPVTGAQAQRPVVSQQPAYSALAQLQSDIRALNSSVLLLSQKMQYLVRNEKILGRNLIVLSKRLKEFESTGGANGTATGISEETAAQLRDVASKLESHGEKLLELQNDLSDVKEHYAKNDTVREMKYVVDTINPMDFITLKQFDELLEKKLAKKQK
ncbi:MAG: hypothetical protein Q7R47_06385 [Candidatus Diapherotrites archaeon]|nr:hypothetical protein [Candidatus Diapherotrites archaeon]